MKMLLVVCVAFTMLSCKTEIPLDDVQVDKYINEIDVSQYEDGFQVIYADTYKIAEGHIKDTYKNGYWRFYKKDQLIAEGAYRNGIKHGFWKVFYSNGNIKSEGHYKSGNPYGYWKYYSDKGKAREKRY